MFINCPHCSALVATDPATDLPPERCPRCAARLREAEPHPAEAAHPLVPDQVVDAVPAPTAPLTEAIIATHALPASDAAAGASNATAAAIQSTPMDLVPVLEDRAASDVAEPRSDDRAPEPETIPAPPADDGGPSKPSLHEDAAVTEPAVPSVDNEAAESAADATAPSPAPAPAAAPAPSRRDKPAPSFARTRAPVAPANARRRWTLPSLIAGLSLLLALQWILADRARLAADADWRPFVAQLCAVLRCEMPPWHEPSAFALLDRDVRPHPDVPGALRVTATFRNDARWAQPWPQMVLTLSDVDGRAIGTRAFDAGEYLGTKPTQNELSSGQTATIRMDILEPAPHVVAFAFDFR
jgi:hypothetical protein